MTDDYIGYKFIKRNTDNGVLMEIWQDNNKNNPANSWKKLSSWLENRPGTRVVMNDVVGTYIGTAEDLRTEQKQRQGIDTFSISEQMKDIA